MQQFHQCLLPQTFANLSNLQSSVTLLLVCVEQWASLATLNTSYVRGCALGLRHCLLLSYRCESVGAEMAAQDGCSTLNVFAVQTVVLTHMVSGGTDTTNRHRRVALVSSNRCTANTTAECHQTPRRPAQPHGDRPSLTATGPASRRPTEPHGDRPSLTATGPASR